MATSLDGIGPRLRAKQKRSAMREVLPAPEDIFLAWLMRLPPQADIASAARREIARLDAAAPLAAAAMRLRGMFVEAATAPAAPRRLRAGRHCRR